MRLFTTTAAILLLILALGVAACGDDDDDTGDGGTDATATEDTGDGGADATATEDAGGDDGGDGGVTFVEVDAADFSFLPNALDVDAGIDLTFVLSNADSAPHTLTVYSDADFTEAVVGADTGNVPGGTVGEFVTTLDAGGYFFRCEVHPSQMQGTVTAG